MIFVWSIESILLGLTAMGLMELIDAPLNMFLGQTILAGTALVLHVAAMGMALGGSKHVSCMYLSSLIGVYLMYWDFRNFDLTMEHAITWGFAILGLFSAIATAFSSALGFTPLLFHRSGLMLIPLAIFARYSGATSYNIICGALMTGVVGLGIMNEGIMSLATVIVVGLVTLVLMTWKAPLLMTFVLAGTMFFALLWSVSFVWDLIFGSKKLSLIEPDHNEHVVVRMGPEAITTQPNYKVLSSMSTEFKWPSVGPVHKKEV